MKRLQCLGTIMTDEQFELDGDGLIKDAAKSGNANDFSSAEVLDEIERQGNSKRSWVTNLIVLGVTLLVFFRIGLIKNGVGDIVSIIVVLLVHEMGHLIGMRMFGYKNVQMFFIPMLGAAVSGQSQNTAGYKKAIVSLMGPVPGIFIGIGCMIASFFIVDGQWCYRLGVMFAAINGFNLLPFFPLDGGRVAYDILFSRNQYLELIFRVLAALALMGAGLLMGAWILGIFGFVSLVSVPIPFKLAKIAKQIRQLHFSKKDENIYANLEAEETAEVKDYEGIPSHIADDIVERVCSISGKMSLKVAASHTKEVWERVQIRHPGVLATVLLLVVHFITFCIPVVGLVAGATINAFRSGDYEVCEIVEYETSDGETRQKEQAYVLEKLSRETDLSADGKLYHGKALIYYSDGAILKEYMWYEGKWDGECKSYDIDGNMISITTYDKGKFVFRKEMEDGVWIEKGWDDLSAFRRNILKEHENAPPKGPDVQEDADDGFEVIDGGQ